jgi:STE24 endopeptidase
MRLRNLALCLCLLLPFALTGCASETPAEHAANVYAANEMATCPTTPSRPTTSPSRSTSPPSA